MSDLSDFEQHSQTPSLSALGRGEEITPKGAGRLLVLSNGHGEDAIALRIVRQILQLPNPPEISALPIVGEGRFYQELGIPLIGSVRTLPSGGFLYMDGKQLMRDVRGGLLPLTLSQIKSIRRWVGSPGKPGLILAVGDIVPLLFAWVSGANYAFVGTAKSEYYVRDEIGVLPRSSRLAWWENFSGSIYHPWERWLMSDRRCLAVFPRDSLTTEILKKFHLKAYDLGNPMMDDLDPVHPPARFYSYDAEQKEIERPFTVTLLPGSRPPEAYRNWEVMLSAITGLIANFRERSLVFLGAIAPSLDCNTLGEILASAGWRTYKGDSSQIKIKIPDPQTLTFKQKNAYIILTQRGFNDCLHQADMAIAMAGTATEQFIGLGKPAITIPGEGPQFNPSFAEAQSRHLGASVILVDVPSQVVKVVRSLLADPDRLQIIADNGVRRMGKPGASRRIAEFLVQRLG
jgi:uncharacterized protein (TIGR03492 family)